MVDKSNVLVIPLRQVYKKSRIRRANTAMRHLRIAVARKTKTNIDNVLIDPALNQLVWAHGAK
ncbi:MAG: 50S ribosomal protein L31e, partial [Candidatus Diapherotrites archaeon]|nr:50S ribosomal protein L31e [Candidatus Diapherotrites archaeon]